MSLGCRQDPPNVESAMFAKTEVEGYRHRPVTGRLTVLQTPDEGTTLLIDVASGAVTSLPDGVHSLVAEARSLTTACPMLWLGEGRTGARHSTDRLPGVAPHQSGPCQSH
jgi:hypothetical protein